MKTVLQVSYLQGPYQDAGSTKHWIPQTAWSLAGNRNKLHLSVRHFCSAAVRGASVTQIVATRICRPADNKSCDWRPQTVPLGHIWEGRCTSGHCSQCGSELDYRWRDPGRGRHPRRTRNRNFICASRLRFSWNSQIFNSITCRSLVSICTQIGK